MEFHTPFWRYGAADALAAIPSAPTTRPEATTRSPSWNHAKYFATF